MLTIFFALASAFVESGFGTALIQDKAPTQTDYSTVFYFNIVVAISLYIVFYLSAPLIATFYEQPDLIGLIRIMSLTFVISSLSLIHGTILVKGIEFKTLAKINILSVVLSGAAAISMAYAGFGVWSLAFQSIVSATSRTILLWVYNPWKPALAFSLESFRRLFGFGSKLLASALLYHIFENIYTLIIGKTHTAAEVGSYSQAKNMSAIPTVTVTSIIQSVTFPVLASIQGDDQRLKAIYRKIVRVVVCITFPMALLLFVVAEPLIAVLLTERWLSIVPLFQLLCLAGLTYPLSVINLNILKVKGRSDIFLVLEIVKKVLIVAAIVVTLHWGVVALVVGQVVSGLVGSMLDLYYSSRAVNYQLKEQLMDILPYLGAAIVMAIAGHMVVFLSIDKEVILLGLQATISIAAFIGVCKAFALDGFGELIAIVKTDIMNRKLWEPTAT
jgi:O-antigen/teichoic acid export membrane protein